jgi:hypothetical protein
MTTQIEMGNWRELNLVKQNTLGLTSTQIKYLEFLEIKYLEHTKLQK